MTFSRFKKSSLRAPALFLAATTAVVFTACNENSMGAPPVAGTECAGGAADQQCLGVKVVSYTKPDGTPSLSQEEAVKLFQEVNQLWASCGIRFQIDEYQTQDPTKMSLSYGAESQSELPRVRETFSNSSTLLLALTGAWDTPQIAWTEMPAGGAPYGAVVDANYADHSVTVAHELGHYLGLDHNPDKGKMMYYIVYDENKSVTPEECSTARETIQEYWGAMLR